MANPAKPTSLPIPWPEDAKVQVYTGGCHCKKIRYEFEFPDIYTTQMLSCNCSICEDRGYIHAFTPSDKFRFTSGSEKDLTTYNFGSGTVAHRFCATCGTSVGPPIAVLGAVSVNARTIDDIDIGRLQLLPSDGKSK
ncbi:GFA domain-containing protein [Favolaschia claudopus]|uniref:GFA domain-containing protein n=1 Tax=Favolaschia claudopus TaxID=2862362 RepID=A0AAW0DB54_9AGAR